MDIKIDRDAFLNEMPDDTVEPEIIDELRKKLIQFTKELESVPEGSVEYKHIMQEAKNYIDKFSALYAERVRLVSRERIIEGFMKSDFPEVKERYLNKEINLNWLINGYNKDSLKWMAKEYLSLSGLSKLKKKELVDLVVEKMQDPDIFMRRVSLLDDECVRIIEHLIKSDGIDILYIKDSVLYGLEASDMVFDVTIAGAMEKDDGHKGIFCIPKEMSDLYAAYCDDAFQERRRRINWILKCAKVASIIYGVLEWDILKKLCAVQYNLTIDELRELFDYIIREENPLCRHKGLLANSMIDSDDVDYLISEQNGKDYYIPGKDEIEEIYAYGAILSNKYAEKMIKYLQKVFKMSEKEARSCTIEIYEMINYNQRMQVIVDRFEENGYIFNSEEDFISFAYVFMEFQNNSRIMHNRGFTPAELSKRVAVRNSGQLSAMPKIGRNDPCPCGSGKKYKNCCGRLN